MRSPTVVHHTIRLGDRTTCVTLEDAFWLGLKEIARGRRITLSDLVGEIAARRIAIFHRRFGCMFWSSIAAKFLTLRMSPRVFRGDWCSHPRRANLIQGLFAQDIGIAFPRLTAPT